MISLIDIFTDTSIMATRKDPREEMERLPKFLQSFLTWLTGKPSLTQQINKKLPNKTLLGGLLRTLLLLFCVEIALFFLWSTSHFLFLILLPFLWMVIVNASRNIQVSYCHHIAHSVKENDQLPYEKQLTNNEVKYLYVIGEILTIILLLPSFRDYAEEHYNHHHGADKDFTNRVKIDEPSDPDLHFLYELGFRIGMSKEVLWKRLKQTIFSPRFHYLFFKKRVFGRFFSHLGWRLYFAFIFWGIVGIAVVSADLLVFFFVVWIIPIVFLYQISALLQFTCEHNWNYHGESSSAEKFTFGRFCGEIPPQKRSPLSGWIWWWFKMLCVHLPTRVFVLVGDLPHHDWHHKEPLVDVIQWRNSEFEREKYIKNTGSTLIECWGLYECIDRVFSNMSQQ